MVRLTGRRWSVIGKQQVLRENRNVKFYPQRKLYGEQEERSRHLNPRMESAAGDVPADEPKGTGTDSAATSATTTASTEARERCSALAPTEHGTQSRTSKIL